MNTFLILGILSFFAVLTWDLVTDIRKWKAGKPVKHGKEAWIRAGLLFPSGVMFVLFKDDLSLKLIAGIALFMIGVYWFLFDGLYNVFRGKRWGYFGSIGDPGGDSFFDELQRRIGLKWSLVIKAGMIAIGVLLYVIS